MSESSGNSENQSHSIIVRYGELDQQFLLVEMPCFVKSIPTALNMLGINRTDLKIDKNSARNHEPKEKTSQYIGDQLLKSGTLNLKLPCDHDPFRHDLEANSITKNGILIKIRRKKNSIVDEENHSVEVIGSVSKSFIFNNPADYHVLLKYFII